jgi:phosphopantothenoylcysteine decarboxylase/phosphopantothenate--cysteine ligase
MIIANDVSNADIGFNSDSNSVTAFWGENQQDFPRASKSTLSHELIELIAHQYTQNLSPKEI